MQVKWPHPDAALPFQKLGVTWIELSLSYILHTQLWIPVKRPDLNQDDRLFQPSSLEDIRANNVHLTEVSEMFCSVIKNAENLSDAKPWPTMQKKPVNSLYVLGAKIFSQGFIHRPEYPHQHLVQQCLIPYLLAHPGPAFEQFPIIDIITPAGVHGRLQEEIAGSWAARCHTAYAEFKRVRKWQPVVRGQQQLRF